MTDIAAIWGARPRLARGAVAIILGAVLVVACLSGMVGPYIAMLTVLLSLLVLWDRDGLALALRNIAVRCFLAAFALLAIAFAATAKRPEDMLAVFDFTVLPLSVAAFALFVRRANDRASLTLAWLALAGSFLGVLGGLVEVYVLHMGRATGGFSSIFYSDLGVMLGFLALMGLFAEGFTPRRWLFALGPLFGVGTIVLGGTRGAVLAYLALSLLVIGFASVRWWRRPLFIVGAVAVLIALVAGPAVLLGLTRFLELPQLALAAFADGETADASVNYRLQFYEAGLAAFAESPLFGHGWWERFRAAMPYMDATSAAYTDNYRVAHLHNDAINFASAAGLLGLAAYLLMLAAPVAGAIWAPRDRQWRPRLYAALALSIGFATMGLTDAIFVFELPKTFYCFVAVILIAYCRDTAPTGVAQ